MIYDVYIQKLIESILNNINNKIDNFVFIKHYNILGLTQEDVKSMIKENNEVCLLYHEFKYNEIQNPYEPFIEWISKLYYQEFSKEMTPEEFIDKCGVYKLQKSIFVSFIKTGECIRDDEVLLVELSYEKMRFIKSLIGIFEYISSKRNILMVLSKIHLANYSTIYFLQKIMNQKTNSHIGILATYNEAFSCPSYMTDVWENLKELVEINNFIYDWATLDKQKEDTTESIFIPKIVEANDYVIKINNMICAFAFEQAEHYLELIYQKIEYENLDIDILCRKKILLQFSLLNLYQGTYNKALVLCESVRTSNEINKDDTIAFMCNYIAGMVFIQLSQVTSARKSYEECVDIAKRTNDNFLCFKAELLKTMITYFNWTDLYAFNLIFEADTSIIGNMKKYGYINALAHMYVYGLDRNKNELGDIPEVFETIYIPSNLKKGMDLANEIGNDLLMSTAYMNTIDFYRGINNFRFIENIYKECIDLKSKSDDKDEVADLYNGIGYNCSIVEKFVQANEYYNEAINIFYEENLPEKIGETLYNMAFNCMQAMDFKKALEYIDVSINIMEELGFQGYRMCKNSKLYGLAALCNYHIEADYNCYMYLNKIERIINHVINPSDDNEPVYEIWAEDLFLYYYVSGAMAKKNNDFVEAEKAFEKANDMIKWSEAFKCFSYPILTIEMSRLYKITQREDKADEIINNCITFCEENGYCEKQKVLLNEKQNVNSINNKKIDLCLKNITFEQIIEVTNDYTIDLQLKNRLNDIEFLARWQDKLDKDDSELTSMLNLSMKTIQNNFAFDRVIYLKVEDDKLVSAYDSEEKKISESNIAIILEFFEYNKSAFVASRTDKYFTEYETLLKIFESDMVVTIVGIPIMNNEEIDSILIGIVNMHRNFYSNKQLLDEKNLVIIKYVFGQFVDAVERLKSYCEIEIMNKKLQKIASTDLLTGLLNRQGFLNLIRSKKFDDKIMKDDNKEKMNAMLYIDLDNFKYYNDTVGHEMGDYVLKLFAEILKKCSGNEGYAVRYGGDEFILILFNKNNKDAILIAKEIYKEIESGFIDEIETKLSKKITIDMDKKISCCIGITEFAKYDENSVERALNEADEALYYVKNTTKHNYRVWDKFL